MTRRSATRWLICRRYWRDLEPNPGPTTARFHRSARTLRCDRGLPLCISSDYLARSVIESDDEQALPAWPAPCRGFPFRESGNLELATGSRPLGRDLLPRMAMPLRLLVTAAVLRSVTSGLRLTSCPRPARGAAASVQLGNRRLGPCRLRWGCVLCFLACRLFCRIRTSCD